MLFPRITNMNTNLTQTPPYTLRPATLEDAFEIWSVMDISCKAMEQKEHFICDDLDYVKNILSGHGFGVVACDTDGKIVGNLLVKYPGLKEDNLGYDVFTAANETSVDSPISPASQHRNHTIVLCAETLMRVLHMDSASVLPEHRGHHLEKRMIHYAETLIDTSKYSYALATVAPENFASLKSLQRNGYQIWAVKEKYGGLVRCVMLKKL